MKSKCAVVWVCLMFMAGCASYESKQIKILQDGLQPMLGHKEAEVLDLITKTWTYGLLDHWEAQNPTVEYVRKKNFRTFGFSKDEAAQIFAQPGAYKVLIFTKPLRREFLTTGQMDSMGSSILGTMDRNVSATHGYIRIVIWNGKLAHYWAGT